MKLMWSFVYSLFTFLKRERWMENSKSETQILNESGILTKYDSIQN